MADSLREPRPTTIDSTDVAVQLERRRKAVSELWNLDSEVVLIGAGTEILVPGRADRPYPFRSHSEYLYLTDRERSGGVLAFDPSDGWVDFVRPVTRDERVWEGASESDEEETSLSGLSGWLEQRKDRPVVCLGVPPAGTTSNAELESDLRYALNHVRRQKDAVELERMRVAERVTGAGFAAIAPLIEPGRTEREVQIELEAAFFRNGADFLAFATIVGGGPNSAVLHFPPTSRSFADGDLVLIDAGGEYRGYCSDITRTYPVSGSFTTEQQEIYTIVMAASDKATSVCAVDSEWRDVHHMAALVIAKGLIELGLLRGQPEDLVDSGVQSLFFPHGIGHMVGLGIRDAGEALRGRERPGESPGIRMDLPLLPGFVVTVEPGIYFIPALLHDPEVRERHRDSVDWERAEGMLGFGGIRVENNVLITEDGYEVLTKDVPLLVG